MLPFIALSLQAAYASHFGPSDLKNPNLLFPESSVARWYDAGLAAHSHVIIWNGAEQRPDYRRFAMTEDSNVFSGPAARATTPAGFGPSDVRAAYNIPSLSGTKAIAIVDAYHYATALNDFNVFAKMYGLPLETSTNATLATNTHFQVVYQGTTAPSVNSGWNMEAALDIEWVHAIAPNAKIYLVEANSSSLNDMYAATKKAATLANVKEVSMSWGAGEYSGETSADSTFSATGVVFFASSGDTTAVQEYPSESPNVVAVGGTSLVMSNGAVTKETPWSGAGGGISKYEAIPSYQKSIASYVGTKRGAADVCAIADPNTGVAVYDSTTVSGRSGWMVVGGTSLACPVTAAITNVSGSFLGSSPLELAKIYGGLGGANFRKISGPTPKATWYYAVGVGSPLGTKGL